VRFTGPGSALDRVLTRATRAPSWGSLLSALMAYALLHPIAVLQMPEPVGMIDVAATGLARLFVSLAQIGQYLLPLAFLAFAMIAGFNRWRRSDLRSSVVHDMTGSILRGLSWVEFELLVSESFQRRGFEVSAAGTSPPNARKGLQLSRNGRCFLVDYSDWRSWRVGSAVVRELNERVEMTGTDGAFAVTSGQFTPEAKRLAAGKNIELIDGRQLKELVRCEPRVPQGKRSSPFAVLLSTLAQWRGLITPDPLPLRPQNQVGEPRIWPDAEPWSQTGGYPIRRGIAAPYPTAQDADEIAGVQLTQSIREERDLDSEFTLHAPPVHGSDAPGPGSRRPRPRIRFRMVTNILGTLLAISALSGFAAWFLQLPKTSTYFPWSLLGAGGGSDVSVRRLGGIERSASNGRIPDGERPLGQFQFGPPGRIAELKSRIRTQGAYGSLQELEAAFDSKYVPPPECYAWESNSQMVKCGNHRIRARQAFIASGGEETPMLLGSWEDPSDNWRPYEQWVQQQGGDWEQHGQPYTPDEEGQSWSGGGEQDATRFRVHEYALEPDQDWRSEDAWNSGQHLSPQEELIQSPQSDGRSGHGQDEARSWRQEFARGWGAQQNKQRQLSPQQDWGRDWARGTEPEQDWRRG